MSDDLTEYDGKWVAMRDGRVIAHADDEETLRTHADVAASDLLFPVGEPASGWSSEVEAAKLVASDSLSTPGGRRLAHPGSLA